MKHWYFCYYYYYVTSVVVVLRDALTNQTSEINLTAGLRKRVLQQKKYIALETDSDIIYAGIEAEFYISFPDDLFITPESPILISYWYIDDVYYDISCYGTSIDRVETQAWFQNVQSFTYSFPMANTYMLQVQPVLNYISLISDDLPGEMIIETEIVVDLQVDSECRNVSEFLIDNTTIDYFTVVGTKTKAITEWTVITKSGQCCKAFLACTPRWTIEKLHITFLEKDFDFRQCLNKKRKREVDTKAYTSHILHVPLPGLGRESGFVLQPFTLPPGLYQICNTVSNKAATSRHCGFLELTSKPNDCQPFINALRIKLTPEPEEFMWPLTEDLIFNVTKYYSIYALQDAGYAGESIYRHMWTCSGDVLCRSIKQKKRILKVAGENYMDIELDEQGTSLLIPKMYQTENTNVTFRFTVECKYAIDQPICSRSVERKVTFVSSAYPGVSIKCYLNCFHHVNPEVPLLIGLNCNKCNLYFVNIFKINWSFNGVQQAKMSGNGTQFLTLTDLGSNISPTFMVRVKMLIRVSKTSYQEISLGKIFTLSKPLPDTVIQTTDYIQQSQESCDVNYNNIMFNLQRYKVSLDKFISSVGHIFTQPLITTVTLIYEKDEVFQKRPGIHDYVLLRTAWAPLDFCIESVSGISHIRVKLSTTDGLHNINMTQSLFKIPTQLLDVDVDIEAMLLIFQDAESFIVNDQTYLAAITTAIEMAANSFINEDFYIDDNKNISTGNTSQLENVTQTQNESKTSASLKYMTQSDLKNVITNVSGSGTQTVHKLSELIERILSFMASEQNGITYSNINLYLVTIIRMMSIRIYTLSVLEKATKVLENAQALHQATLEDPSSDDDLIRLKLEAIYTLTTYFLQIRKFIQTDLVLSQIASSIINSTFAVAMDIPERIPWRYPVEKPFARMGYSVTAFWVDPYMETHDLTLQLLNVKLVLSIAGLRDSQISFIMNTFLNVAAYTVDKSVLPITSSDFMISAPLVHISIKMKHRIKQPFYIKSPGTYTIHYKFDFQNATSTNYSGKIAVYGAKNTDNAIHDSDCIFFRVEAARHFATLLTFHTNLFVKLGVRVKLANKMSEGLKSINVDKIFLPQSELVDLSCDGIVTRQYTIFLPALSLRQQSELKGSRNYYIIVEIEGNQSLKPQNIRANLVQIGEETVNINCLKASCLQWSETWYTPKDCYITHCSGGVPPILSCRCDKGQTFTAGTSPCSTSQFVIFKRHDMQMREFNFPEDYNYIIPVFVVFMWLLFLAFYRIACRLDVLEKPLGKTLALPGVFSPFVSKQYLMCFITGFGRCCGTMSIPYMTIIGTNNISPRYKLESRDFIFVNGSEIWLLVSVPYDLGRLKGVVLSLEDRYTKLSPWFIENLYIKDIISGEEWECLFNTWIPDKSNHNFPFIVSDANQTQGHNMMMFRSIFLSILRNQHPVFGIFYNVPGRDFTKVLHVAFCFCGLHFLMLICLLFHNTPKQMLTVDPVTVETFSLKPDLYTTAAYCAFIVVLPIYFMGILLQTSRHVDTCNIEWYQTMKQPRDRQYYKKKELYAKDELPEMTVSAEFEAYSTSIDDPTIALTNNIVGKPYSNSILEQNTIGSSKTFRLPILIFLAVMSIICVSVSYYIMILGLYFNTTSSLEYVYIVCIAFIFLAAIIYPLLLMVVAIINIALYIYGLPFYGVQRDSVLRVEKFLLTLPFIIEVANLDILETSMRTLGHVDNKVGHSMRIMRSQRWCKQLMLTKLTRQRKQIWYNTTQIIFYIIITLVIINVQIGSVSKCFMQTNYVGNSMGVGRVTDKPDKAMTTEEVWNHLFNIIYTIKSWSTRNTTVPLTLLSAVRVRQVRSKPFLGNCSAAYPKLIKPRCIFSLEESEIETRDFGNMWSNPLTGVLANPGPYTYTHKDYFTLGATDSYHYPGGGYDTLLSLSNKPQETLEFLKDNKWIDDKTKAVVVSINLINVDSGLSTVIEHVYEFRLMGIFMYTTDIDTFQLVLSQGWQMVLSFLFIVFFLMTLHYFILEIRSAFHLGIVTHIIFTQCWLLSLERCLSLGVIVTFFLTQSSKKQMLSQISDVHVTEMADSAFINFKAVSYLTFDLVLISCLLVIVCLIKVILKFEENIHMQTFVNMIIAVSKLLFIPILSTVAFALLGYLLFHTLVMYYQTVTTASGTVTVLMLDASALVPTIEAGGVIGRIYITVLFCVLRFLMLHFFIGLINETYSEIKHINRRLDKTVA